MGETKKKGLSIWERIAYGCGDAGCNVIYTAMTGFLLLYYTDYAGVSAGAVGVIMLISRIFDGVSDLIMGNIVDRTHSRFGKARPWILRMCLPFAVAGILLFSVPTSWTSNAKLVYVFITYNLVSTVIYTAINVPYSSLNALMTQDPYERSVLSIFRNLLATAASLFINTFTLRFVEFFGDNAAAWSKTFGVFGIIALVLFLITFAGCKERVKPAAKENEENKTSVMDGFRALFKNKYWIMVTVMLAFIFIAMSLYGGATVYFAKTVLGDRNLVTPIGNAVYVAQIVSMFFVAFFVKKFGKRNVMITGCALSIVGFGLMLFTDNYVVIMFCSVLRGIAGACMGATMWAMVSDTIDYGEWKTGIRTEGLINSACSFGYKIGNGLGSAILGWIISLGGYVDTAEVQSAGAVFSVKLAFAIIPMIIYVVIIVILLGYHLDQEFNGIIADLKKRSADAGKE